jgi:hypothetical protein
MSTGKPHFFDNPKIQQLIVQFAFKIPIRKECNPGEKRALSNVLKELDPEVFQLFDETLQRNPGCLFQVLRQLPVEATTITVPSFVLTNEGFSFIYPLKMVGKPVLGIGSIDGRDANQKMLGWLSKVQEVIPNPLCQRTGKIYELVLGRFSQEEKKQIFSQLFSSDLSNIGELNFTFAEYRNEVSDIYNIQNNIRFSQMKLGEGFFVTLRIDINNRNLFSRMESRDINKVWNFADAIIDDHLRTIITIP